MKKVSRLLSAMIAFAALAYFSIHAYENLKDHDLRQLLSLPTLAASVVLVLQYMALIPILAITWKWLLDSIGQPVQFAVVVPILAATQFGKYLPGNIAHHFGRVVVARSSGLKTAPVMFSMAYETVIMLVACVHVGALTLLWNPPMALEQWPLAHQRGLITILVSIGALCMIMLLPRIVHVFMKLRVGGKAAEQEPLNSRLDWGTVFACYFFYTLAYALVGFGLWLVAASLVPEKATFTNFIFLTGAFASSWVLGFLAPGAPAGLGVREAVLFAWLGVVFGSPVAVSLVIVLRIATTVGDLLNFLLGSWALARKS